MEKWSPTNPRMVGMLKIDPQTYRFKFSDSVAAALADFGDKNRAMDRKSFQKSWKNWLIDNKSLVEEEEQRLNRLGFRGGAVDKMYKSVRYYFSKDISNRKEKPTEQKTPRTYCSLDKEVLEAINADIKSRIDDSDFRPATGYTLFCSENQELLLRTISNLVERGVDDPKVISNKLKKAYKNRYHVYSRK